VLFSHLYHIAQHPQGIPHRMDAAFSVLAHPDRHLGYAHIMLPAQKKNFKIDSETVYPAF